jgi:hypothetical protein
VFTQPFQKIRRVLLSILLAIDSLASWQRELFDLPGNLSIAVPRQLVT